MPCNRNDKEQYKRHREIAELIHELKRIKSFEEYHPENSPLTPKATNTLNKHHYPPEEDNPMSKKERKAAKKARKLVNIPKSVSAADIDFVAQVLDPYASSTDDEAQHALELQGDPDVMLNRAFHRGTSNRRDIRNQFVAKDKRAANIEIIIDPVEIDGYLQLLDVSPLTSNSTTEEKAIHTRLKSCVEKYLVHSENEQDSLTMRKAGFWRWASKRAYERLVLDGQKSSSTATPTTSNGSSRVDTDDSTEPDTEVTTPSEAEGQLELELGGLKISVEVSLGDPNTPKASGGPIKHIAAVDLDDGWTTVGRPREVKKPVGNITLVHNGGLAKMDSPVAPLGRRRGFATSYDHLY